MARILVVDDEPDLRGMVRLIMELEGYDVVEAAHGGAALKRIQEQRVDLLLTDVMMPLMTGAELIDRLRADAAHRDLPIVVISASPHDVQNADHVMRKPFAPAALRQIVRELLGRDARE